MIRLLALALLLCGVSLPGRAAAQREYIRDEIRVNMRAGPGLQYKILKVMTSGDVVRRLGSTDDWIEVATAEGGQGWVPSGYVSAEVPPSVSLPQVTTRLVHSEARVRELEARLATQTGSLSELEALRASAEELEIENAELRWSTGWRSMATGAVVVLVGILIGIVIPRGGSGTRGARRIKL